MGESADLQHDQITNTNMCGKGFKEVRQEQPLGVPAGVSRGADYFRGAGLCPKDFEMRQSIMAYFMFLKLFK